MPGWHGAPSGSPPPAAGCGQAGVTHGLCQGGHPLQGRAVQAGWGAGRSVADAALRWPRRRALRAPAVAGAPCAGAWHGGWPPSRPPHRCRCRPWRPAAPQTGRTAASTARLGLGSLLLSRAEPALHAGEGGWRELQVVSRGRGVISGPPRSPGSGQRPKPPWTRALDGWRHRARPQSVASVSPAVRLGPDSAADRPTPWTRHFDAARTLKLPLPAPELVWR